MAYFNNAATTHPKNEEALEKAVAFYKNHATNVGRNLASANEGNIIDKARESMKKLFCVDDSYIVVFQPSATYALNVILQGLDFAKVKTVYISPFEHNAVTRVLHALRKKHKFDVIELEYCTNLLRYKTESIKKQFNERRPDVVIVSHASNVFGILAPIKEIFKLAKEHGSFTVADMAQTLGLVETNVIESYIDCAVFAGHKTLYAMSGVGGFIIKRNIDLEPILFGGTGVDSLSQDMSLNGESRYEIGSQNVLAIASLYYSVEYVLQEGVSSIAKNEEKMYNKLVEVLSAYKNIEIVGKSNNSVGIVSCLFKRLAPDEVEKILHKKGIEVRSGLQCSPSAHKTMGTFPAGTVRFSVGRYTADKDIIALQEALDYIEENT